jgi:hypothetical protein
MNDEDILTYNGNKEIANFFRERSSLVMINLAKGMPSGFVESGSEKLTIHEYLARCM